MQILLPLVFILAFGTTSAQIRTVGVLQHDVTKAMPGYTLFAPMTGLITYLIDNDGYVVHSWASSFRPGQSAELLDDGTLLRTGTPNGNQPLNGGGAGGYIERIAWDGTLLWQYQLYSGNGRAHHDVEMMPNGNVLALVWYPISKDSAIALGRIPSNLLDQTMWLERVIEIRPNGLKGGDVVWTWDVHDHLVQNTDQALPNFGVIAASPNRVNINAGGYRTDWLHTNSIRYNAARDEIMISVHNISEIWIIKKSTGTIVYRWGNPQIYDRGTSANRKLFAQHDARWINDTLPGGGNILIFNNGPGRPAGNYSSLDEIIQPLDNAGNYILDQGAAFGPLQTTWTYIATPPSSFFGANISGSTRQPNGNTLACLGPQGTLVEVTTTGEVVWQYVSPVGLAGTVMQGQIPQNNLVFKVYRYQSEHPALMGKTLTRRGRLEEGPLSVHSRADTALQLFYAPGSSMATAISTERSYARIDAYDLLGRWLGIAFNNIVVEGTTVFTVPPGTMLLHRITP